MTTRQKDSEKGEEKTEHPYFTSKIGLVCSCLGCVVGTGNIWRFPRIVANNSEEEGGLVFILVWVVFLFLWSSPMLLIEYGTGRFTKKAVIGSFRQMVGERAAWCGAWISMVSFFISCYYSVVLGWCFYYVVRSIGYELPQNADESEQIFYDFARDSSWPVLTHGLAVLLAGLSVVKGVKTIEKVNMVLIPILLTIILFTFAWSLTREYADYGIKFLFNPKWEAFGKPRLWVDAISQNAFDTGAGMGLMIPYATYMARRHAVVKYGVIIPTVNNCVRIPVAQCTVKYCDFNMVGTVPRLCTEFGAPRKPMISQYQTPGLICGIMIFATVFSTLIISRPELSRNGIVEIMQTSGPASTGLTFIWIPVLFSTIGSFGRALCILFFFCLSFAGISSLIANLELVAHTLSDFGVPRKFGMPLTVLFTFLIGLMSALDLDVLTNQDFVWGFALLINGLMLQIMVISYGTSRFRAQVYNDYSLDDWTMPKFWEWMIKFIAPIEAIAIIVWWAIDLIDGDAGDGENWYEFGTETLIVTIVQWFSVMLLVFLINMVIWYYRKNRSGFYSLNEATPLIGSEVEGGGGDSGGGGGESEELLRSSKSNHLSNSHRSFVESAESSRKEIKL